MCWVFHNSMGKQQCTCVFPGNTEQLNWVQLRYMQQSWEMRNNWCCYQCLKKKEDFFLIYVEYKYCGDPNYCFLVGSSTVACPILMIGRGCTCLRSERLWSSCGDVVLLDLGCLQMLVFSCVQNSSVLLPDPRRCLRAGPFHQWDLKPKCMWSGLNVMMT